MRRYICLILSFLFSVFCQGQSLDGYMAKLDLVDVSSMDTTLRIELVYATENNFLGQAVYSGMTRAWLHPDAAGKLLAAHRLLKREHPQWRFMIYDAARPMSVQRKMWALVRGTDKTNYVGNPANGGGLHNYGLAVDLTILDERGMPLPMGSPFDYFGEEAHTYDEEALLKNGLITRGEYENRRLLRRLMRKAGFRSIPYEWWHFNACTRAEARQDYPVID